MKTKVSVEASKKEAEQLLIVLKAAKRQGIIKDFEQGLEELAEKGIILIEAEFDMTQSKTVGVSE